MEHKICDLVEPNSRDLTCLFHGVHDVTGLEHRLQHADVEEVPVDVVVLGQRVRHPGPDTYPPVSTCQLDSSGWRWWLPFAVVAGLGLFIAWAARGLAMVNWNLVPGVEKNDITSSDVVTA